MRLQDWKIYIRIFFSLFAKKIVDANALRHWSECMSSRQWTASISGDIYGDFALTIAWNGHPSVSPNIRSPLSLSGVEVGYTAKLELANGTVFNLRDEYSQLFTRIDPISDGLIVINLAHAENIVIELPPYVEPPAQSVPTETPELFTPQLRGQYFIKALHSDKCFHVRGGSSKDREPLWQWECIDQPHFRFIFQHINGQWYKIRSVGTKKCLHVKSASQELRAPIWQWSCSNEDHFQFKFVPSDAHINYYQIVAKHSGMCLHVKSGSIARRAPLLQWGCQIDNPHFLFSFPTQLTK